MIRVLIADGLRLTREALSVVLATEPGMQVVAQVARGDEIVPSALRTRPNVALLDTHLSGLDGISAASRLKTALPTCRVVLVTALEHPGALRTALAAGVEGFVGKGVSVKELTDTVRKAARGESVLDPRLVTDALRTPDNPLNERDIGILRLASKGHTPQEIAETLHLSPGTVRNNLAAIKHKIGARNRIEAIRTASARGWI
ncbi:DNA-binding response regulator [Streptomyces sp. CC53]|uniref:response regulator transcription factor n=1 Tax=Streptomyces sp. CC53 TaxID=1906740 RepID=UPI0008DCF5C4|nr:response regulator transcription factor [Streptomyces sp. CC53]OII65157.1 DNA-binding response regulator [Streptomyces sp. CC53]